MNPMFYLLHPQIHRLFKASLLPKFCWLFCLWLGSVGAIAQTLPNCPATSYEIIIPINDFTGNAYKPYQFYHRNGTTGSTFYKDETIYSYGVTSDNTCKPPTNAAFLTPVMPTSFTQTCTGINLTSFWEGTGIPCQAPISKTCPKIGPTTWVHSRGQHFQATTTGEFTIPFNNSNGTTVTLTILERYAIYTDCGNLAGSYIETGTQNGKKKFVDSDNNVLYYDDTNAQWVVSGSMGIAYSVASTADAPPLTGWQTKAGSGCIGLNIKVVYGEYTPNFNITYTLNNTCLPEYNGVYKLTSIVDGRPVLTGPNNQQISYVTYYYTSNVIASKTWQIGNGQVSASTPKLTFGGNSMTLPTCWIQSPNPSSSTTCSVSGDAVTVVLSTERAVLNPVNICVQSLCGNYGGIYTPTKLFNERPDMKDEDNNRMFYWGAGDPTYPEGWYIADANNKFVYYNSSNAESTPTTGWQAFTGDGISCTNNIGVFQNECSPCPAAGSIAYSNASYCKNITEATATITGPTGGTFTSTQGLSIDANSGKINPSASTEGTYTITYSLGGANGCAITTAITSVTINELKTPAVSIAPNPTGSITVGTSVTFTATPTHGGTNPSYQWKKNNNNVGTNSATYTDAALANNDVITCVLTSNDACASPTTVTSNEITMAVCTLPTAYTVTGGGTYCAGSSGVAAVGLSNSETGVSYQLKRENVNIGSALVGTGSAFTFGNQTAGVYSVEATRTTGGCKATMTGNVTVSVLVKPSISLTVQQTTLNEGNSQTLCDIDANPVNPLQFTVSSACFSGSPVWRVQVGNGAWSDWSTSSPTTQLSNNQPHRYQAACDANCLSTYTQVIALTLNYRASTPQNVSFIADGTSVAAGEEKTICDQSGNSLTFNATCAVGERVLYSVDGGVYLPEVPTQIVDGQFHNYRVRCQKSDGTVSCVETESSVIRLKISAIAAAPVASLNVTSGCGTPANFSGTANCGALTAVWYNAATNAALPNLPTTTPTETTSYYARCQNEAGCQSGMSNTVTFTITPINNAPVVSVSSDLVCTGNEVTVSTTCPTGASALWNTGITESSFKVAFSNITKQTYSVRCVFANGCQSPISAPQSVTWKGFELTVINIGQSKSAIKTNDRAAWASQFVTPDGGPSLDKSTESNPTLYFSENVNKTGPRYWTIHADACALGTAGSLTFDMLATPESGPVRSFNTHENNAPYFMYANREGYTELYAQNHPAYGFFLDNGAGGNVYDEGLPKGLYKLGVRYWDQKGYGSIFPSTRKPQGNVLAYQEYWFRIQSKDGVGTGAARVAADLDSYGMTKGAFASVMPNPVSNVLRLKVTEAKNQKVSVSLLDASGRTLLQRGFVPETNAHQEEFNVSEMANGMYFLRVTTADKQATLKVIKVE